MQIRLYNTLTHKVEDFQPLEPGIVRTYHCGPTVYDYAHIGNFRAFVFADLLRRFFEFTGHRVEQVMNITDVGHMTEDQLADGGGRDKMEVAAERLKQAKKQGQANVENPDDPYQVAEFFTKAFLEDARTLRLKIADQEADHMPRATRWVTQMIQLIEQLIEAGHAYVTDDGAVYYDVRSFPDYGRLSGNTLDKLQAGAGGRVSTDELRGKRDANDFLLWKVDPRHIMKWDSPWGPGYPGWHIECSAMAMGVHNRPTIDIHTGGEDNIFPHHECEIAQSCGATNQTFARYWMHVRFLLVEGEKMSKSKGNFYTVRDLLAKGVPPEVLRYELLRTHYRSNMNFTTKGIEDSAGAVQRLRNFVAKQPNVTAQDGGCPLSTPVEQQFAAALADDLNISGALGAVFSFLNATPDPTPEDVAALRRIDNVLGVIQPARTEAPTSGGGGDAEIEAKITQMKEARTRKDFATSDKLRDELAAAGIEVRIAKTEITWQRKMRL
jgi:cysteinyl-tRNA synthetase